MSNVAPTRSVLDAKEWIADNNKPLISKIFGFFKRETVVQKTVLQRTTISDDGTNSRQVTVSNLAVETSRTTVSGVSSELPNENSQQEIENSKISEIDNSNLQSTISNHESTKVSYRKEVLEDGRISNTYINMNNCNFTNVVLITDSTSSMGNVELNNTDSRTVYNLTDPETVQQINESQSKDQHEQ